MVEITLQNQKKKVQALIRFNQGCDNMHVSDIVEIAKITFLNNIPVSRNEEALIKFIHLGVSELYRRFNLSIKSETIITSSNLSLYELKNPDISLLLGVYDRTGRELKETDIMDSRTFEYKMVNYKSFLLRNPFDGFLYAVYKASPSKMLKNLDDYIELPDAMIDALLSYVAYIGSSAINKDNTNDTNTYLQRFDTACRELEMQGYKISLSTESLSLHVKGFV